MKKEKRWLYVPIETKVRELHGKTLLASLAALKGFNVIIGSKKDIYARASFLPKGTIFNFGLAKNFAKSSKMYKKYGHRVAVIDEEGLVTLNDDLYLRHRVSKEALEITDMYFCWGKRQASLVERKIDKTNCKIFITGNPRFDMLRPEYRNIFNETSEEIKRKYGKIILVNTNFGHGNHFSGDDYLLNSLREKGWMDEPRDKKFFLENVEWQKRMFKEFMTAIPKLAENFKDHNIIIRPHPSENKEIWKKIEKDFSNVFMIHSGNVIPWIMAADVLIHNGCTTAVEAFLIGTPIVAYRPFIEDEQETELPNKLSAEVYNMEGLTNMIEELINENFNSNSDLKNSYLDSYLSGFRKETASEKIVSILDSKDAPVGGKISFSFFLFEALLYIKKIIRRTLFNRTDVAIDYQLHKVPNITKNEIREIIEIFSKINEEFKNLRIKKIGDTCYQIYKC